MPKLISALHAFNALKGSSARHGTGYANLAGRFIHLYRRRRFSPYEIFFYDLLGPEFSDEALQNYMSREEGIGLDSRHVLDTYLCVTSDKAVFYALCLAAGITVPKLFAVFDRPAGWTPDGRQLNSPADWCAFFESLPREFVVKPALGLLGKGVTAWRREAAGFLGRGGRQHTAEELYQFLCDNKGQNLFATDYSHHSLRLPGESHKSIIQERVYAHPEIEQLTASVAVSTCRLFTHRDREGRTEVLATAIRVINGDNFTDNFDKGTRGNVWCNVDLTTGRIVAAFAKTNDGDKLECITRHPTTRRALVGFRIPRWDEAVALVHRLASVFRPQSLIHWDIGITAGGPVAIEGNVGGQLLPTPLNRPVSELLAQG